MGEKTIWPMTGEETYFTRNAWRRKIYPVVTGSFAESDFMFSMVGNMKNRLVELGYCSENANPASGTSNISLDWVQDKVDAIFRVCAKLFLSSLSVLLHESIPSLSLPLG